MKKQIHQLGGGKIRLIKASVPGWTKEFNNEIDLKEELYTHICDGCRTGDNEFDEYPVYPNSTIDEMLWTACGCEFFVEYDEEVLDF